jgi:hypothetical protein
MKNDKGSLAINHAALENRTFGMTKAKLFLRIPEKY